MITLRGRWLLFSRAVSLFIIFFMVFSVSSSFITARPVKASGWPGWGAINTIYYNPAQDDPTNKYLEQAATELRDHLQKAGKALTITTSSSPASGSIYLEVNPTDPDLTSKNDEAFKLLTDSDGIYLTGKTPLAVREGAYTLLEKLGFRWFFKSPAWSITPGTLMDLNLDEVKEPFYLWRMVETDGTVGTTDSINWNRRNLLFGSESYLIYHSYAAILHYATGWYSMTTQQKVDYGNAHPTYFFPNDRYPYTLEGDHDRPDSYPWQLNPDDPDVINMAIAYARNFMDVASGGSITGDGDIRPFNVVPISPNDGGGWSPPYSYETDVQTITDKVYGLAEAVAANISADYPGKYAGVYGYSVYSNIPSISLSPNIMVHIATDYNGSLPPLQLYEQIEGMVAKGVAVGIRDYLDIWGWNADGPGTNLNRIKDLAWYAEQGVKYYNGEAGDGWCAGGGLTYYLSAKMLWDPTQDVDTLLDDFYTKAFGPAKEVMKHYYETRNTDNVSLASSFGDLDQAESLAAGNNDILERIRQLEYYNRYMWFWKNKKIANLSTDELKSFYTFITKTKNLYIVFYGAVEGTLQDALRGRGVTNSEIAALQDFTPPTVAEARAMLDEALAAFNSVPPPEPSPYINPRKIELSALGDTTTTKLQPLSGHYGSILVPSQGNEDITIMVKGEYGALQWYRSTGMLLDSWSFNNLPDWTPVTFRADSSGVYILHLTRGTPHGSYAQVDVPGRPASIIADPNLIFAPYEWLPMNAPNYQGPNQEYFYVPNGTDNFTFGADVTVPGRNAHGKLTDSNGTEHPFDFNVTSQLTFASPIPGLWKVDIDMPISAAHFWLVGIPPLVWHDPQYLLIQAVGTPAPPILNPIGDKTAHVGVPLQFTVSATDPNNDSLTYSASNLPPWATFTPATRTFSGTANQTGTYSNVQFTVSDGSLTDSENITITVTAASSSPDVNNDGVVNILDMICVVQHWGETGANGWIREDVNNDGKIDVLDITLIGQHWTG